MLDDPLEGEPVNGEAGRMWREDRGKYEERIREWVERFAMEGEEQGEHRDATKR